VSTGRSHWSNGARSAQFFVVNAVACVPLLVLVLRPSWLGLYATMATFACLFWVEKVKKMTLSAFARSINIALTGRVKASLNLFKETSR